MKFALLFVLVLGNVSAFAESKEAIANRERMLTRIDSLVEKLDLAKRQFRKKKVAEGCAIVEEVFQIYPDHLVDIGSKMDLFKKRVNQSKNAALQQIAQLDFYSNILCKEEKGKNIEKKWILKKLSTLQRSLEKQRLVIETHKTGENNEYTFRYNYRCVNRDVCDVDTHNDIVIDLQ